MPAPRSARRAPAGAVERAPWSKLYPAFLGKFRQGEHVAVIGPTGEGKTTLALELLDGFHGAGGSVVMLANKPRDPLYSKLQREGWPRIRQWPPDYDHRVKRRVLLWPAYGRASTAKRNRPAFEYALDMILAEGGWFIYIDEMRYMVEQMGMRTILDEYWNAARSSKVTLIAGSQGATWISRGMVTQETWLFLFRPRHTEDAKLYAEAAGDRQIAGELDGLGRHEFLLVHTPSNERYVSKVGT